MTFLMEFASWVQFGETPSPDVHIPAKHISRGPSLFIRFFDKVRNYDRLWNRRDCWCGALVLATA
jgi:hypothetical protein